MSALLRSTFATLLVVSAVAAADDAAACGLTPPIGPNGLPTQCRDQLVRVHAALTAGGTATTIDFGGGDAELVQTATVASVDVIPLDRLTLTVSGGASIGGRLDYQGTRYDLAPGWTAGAGVSYVLFGRSGAPFVQPSFAYSLARAATRGPDGNELAFSAKDWRAGLVVGRSFGRVFAPFVFGRYFGGGTEWATGGHGSDHYRYHAGAGSVFALSDRFDALFELAFLGERRATMGVGYTF
jgi:hypothetical protein